ncbi:MAG: hypothetical protein GY811_15785 [Myxococcales bacterium]|nr:hypothetical protein [Myxococcales bacterium]
MRKVQKPLLSSSKIHDKATSVKSADRAVMDHLAQPLITRGPKGKRLTEGEALTKIQGQWKIQDTKLVANADPKQHPITGYATVIVKAEGPVKGKVFPSANKREFIVHIGSNGKATVIGNRSDGRFARALRTVNEKLAVSRIVRDIASSSGVRKGVSGIGVLALAVLAGHSSFSELGPQMVEQFQALGPVVLTAASISAKNGFSRRTEARLFAFEQLTQKLNVEITAGKTITLETAYARYEQALKSVKMGSGTTKNVKAPSRQHFVKALAAWEMSRTAK